MPARPLKQICDPPTNYNIKMDALLVHSARTISLRYFENRIEDSVRRQQQLFKICIHDDSTTGSLLDPFETL